MSSAETGAWPSHISTNLATLDHALPEGPAKGALSRRQRKEGPGPRVTRWQASLEKESRTKAILVPVLYFKHRRAEFLEGPAKEGCRAPWPGIQVRAGCEGAMHFGEAMQKITEVCQMSAPRTRHTVEARAPAGQASRQRKARPRKPTRKSKRKSFRLTPGGAFCAFSARALGLLSTLVCTGIGARRRRLVPVPEFLLASRCCSNSFTRCRHNSAH